nr:unnamed protein product [Digitaria exilis]
MDPGAGGAARAGFERACRLPNTVHSEIAPTVPLPNLPPAFGFDDLRDDEPLAAPDRPDMIMQAAEIARILADTDVSHLGFTEADNVDVDPTQCSWLWREVLKHNPDAFRVKPPAPPPTWQGPHEGPQYQNQEPEKYFEHLTPNNMNIGRKEPVYEINSHREQLRNELTPDSVASKKPKNRKKEIDNSVSSSGPSIPNSQEVITNFCEMVEDFCGRVEIPDDADGGDWLSIPLNDVKVSSIVEADPEVLGDKRVQSAVEGRFCDSAISVREAALELVGRHIASHPDVGLKYIEKVAERIKDTGVSVRKRAIKIIRDLCASNPNTDTTHAFVEIISRVNDEESSVQDLVCKTFYELWFEEPTGSHKHLVADGSSVPMEIAKKTEQIVDMLRKMPNHQPLITVIKRNLTLDFLPQSTKAAGINSSMVASLRKRCELICKRLLERILQVEEGAANAMEIHALPYIVALQAFCIVDPTLCIPATDPSKFVVTLQPYLKIQIIGLLQRKYLLRDDFNLKVRALQTMGYILIAKPEFMLQKEIMNLIEATLSSGVDHRLKIQGLQNLYEYLRDAESQLTADSTEKPPVRSTISGGSVVPVAAGAGDTNICGGIIQLYWSSILESTSDVDMAKVQEDCQDAIALQLLLKLKRHLKIVYGLTDARCQAFSLKEPPKSGETLSKQNVPFNIGNNNMSLPNCLQDVASVYQDFKTVLREDSMDFSVYTPSVQKKRPTPRTTSRARKTAATSVPRARGDVRGDDDDTDDDDWTGGPRVLDFSAQASNGGRVTRQRVQV